MYVKDNGVEMKLVIDSKGTCLLGDHKATIPPQYAQKLLTERLQEIKQDTATELANCLNGHAFESICRNAQERAANVNQLLRLLSHSTELSQSVSEPQEPQVSEPQEPQAKGKVNLPVKRDPIKHTDVAKAKEQAKPKYTGRPAGSKMINGKLCDANGVPLAKNPPRKRGKQTTTKTPAASVASNAPAWMQFTA